MLNLLKRKEGTEVKAYSEKHKRYRKGTIIEIACTVDGDRYFIRFHDGTKSWINEDQIELTK